MNREFFQRKGREGGKKGGKATGDCKRRSPEHYQKMVEARKKKSKRKKDNINLPP